MTSDALSFQCPLRGGLHARPASLLAQVAARYEAEVILVNGRTGATANAKSVLAVISSDVKHADPCQLRVVGSDAAAACRELAGFLERVLPVCDDVACDAGPTTAAPELPRTLRHAAVRHLRGQVVQPGIGRGLVVDLGGLPALSALPDVAARGPAAEHDQFRSALSAVRVSLETQLAGRGRGPEVGILRAHLSIATDPSLIEHAERLIAGGAAAAAAVGRAAAFFAARCRAAESRVVRERALDIEDVGLQLIEHVLGQPLHAVAPLPAGPTVVVAASLTPRQVLELPRGDVRGIVLEAAGATSHAAILARALGIPTLAGVEGARVELHPGTEVIVDAHHGLVLSAGDPHVEAHFARVCARQARRDERERRRAHQPAMTLDGQRIEVAANVAGGREAARAFERGAEGIGLFRTEMLFLGRDEPPDEEAQLASYVEAIRAAAGRPVIIRTLDVGADKPAPYLHLPAETNPQLGYRGVRVYAEHGTLLHTQLRAILRASAAGPVWVMIPMVTSLAEVELVRERLRCAQAELAAAGVAFNPHVRVGVMVETPAVAMQMPEYCAAAEFFSIGTNDLVQYVLAVDRENIKVASLHDPRHPAVLRLLDRIVQSAHAGGRWVGLCGEMAGCVENLPLLIGLGLDEISLAAGSIPRVKDAIGRLSAERCRKVLAAAMTCHDAREVEALLTEAARPTTAEPLVAPELVRIEAEADDKSAAIASLVDLLYVAGRTDRPSELEDALWAREDTYSTGLGHGFAVPHCKSPALAAASIAALRLRRPVEWGAVDGEPVRCAILLGLPESADDQAHMRVLARLARRLMHAAFRDRLLAAADADAFVAVLTAELELDGVGALTAGS